MPNKIKIALDVMGGDHAPDMVLEGAALACQRYADIELLLYGPESLIQKCIEINPELKGRCEVIHTDESVSAEDKPSQALRRGRKSSMGLALSAVKEGHADVAVSAGNTGALLALSKFILRTLPGIDRPALISSMPTLKGETCMLDLGANIECSAKNLVQFAVMGASYMRAVLGQNNPSVGLLNVGVEELKGSDALREASCILSESDHLHMDFKGFVEADKIGKGEVDVFVTDGFTGNIALKTIEGTATFMSELIRRAFTSSILSKIGYLFSLGGINALRSHLDPNHHNGGVFIGLNGLVVKSHGGANAEGFASAIGVAFDMSRNNLNDLIAEDLAYIADECNDKSD